MTLIAGERYTVRYDHPFHANKTGFFEFMGGPNADVVVLCTRETGIGTSWISKQMIAVSIGDVQPAS